MKDFYYFSKRKLKFVEIQNFQKKFLFLTLFFSFIISFLIFGTYFVINGVINPDSKVKSLQVENRELTNRLKEIHQKFEEMDDELVSLSETNTALRLKTNLAPLENNTENIGVGGSVFGEISSSNSEELGVIISSLNGVIDKIDSKIKFEKSNYSEIEDALTKNELLFNAIPAIKPCEDGYYGDRFGMRMHPILKRKRMHNGVDIVVDVGANVHAPGDGKVIFAGRRGGYGWTVEIEHGFGYRTLYAHLSKLKVKKGQKVKRGELIALSGKSGNLATGAHLHYEVRHNGIALNPRNFIYDDVKIFEIVSSD
jgi:murein DD-endopeptidase MepM/ murein hydrolase activator NlpD